MASRGHQARTRAVALGITFGLLAGCGASDAADDDEPAAAGTGGGAETDDVAAGGGAAAPADDAPAFPDPDWAVVDPVDAGLDPAPLDELQQFLGRNRSDCMAVVHQGRIVAEHYWGEFGPDDDREVFSATKSVSSTLVGIAQDQGYLDIDDPASTWISEWNGGPSEAVTVRNLLANDSGREYDFALDYQTMAMEAEDKTTFAIGLGQQHAPGEQWEYNNSAIQTLEAVLERSTGQDVAEFAEENLFAPLGMSVEMLRDAAGNPLTFMGVRAGCRDMARFGYLFEQGGRWGDEQIVPEAWVEEATTPSQDLRPVYGYLWWLNTDGEMFGELPHDAYAALGMGNQIVLVIPSADLVVVRLGQPPTNGATVASQGSLAEMIGTYALDALPE